MACQNLTWDPAFRCSGEAGSERPAEEGVHGRKTDPGEGGRTQGCPDGNPFMQRKRNRVCRTGPVRKGLKKDGITESVPWTGMHACLAASRHISSRSAREMRAQKKLSVRVGQTVLKRFCVLLSQDSWPAHPVSRQRQMPCRESHIPEGPRGGCRSDLTTNTQKGQKA